MPSEVWKYFERTSDRTHVVCSLCDVQLAYKSSTSSMSHHLKSRHGDLLQHSDRSRSDVDSDLDASSSSNNGSFASATARSSPRGHQASGRRERSRSAASAPRYLSQEKSESITQALADMIARDMLPLSFCENEGFQKFMEVDEPAYKVPSRHTVERRIERRGEDIKEKIKGALKEAESVAISSDGWTSIANEAYQTVTAHFVNPNWELESVTLSTSAMEESHTGENIAERIYHVACEYDIEGKTYGLVRDNASNMDSAARFLDEEYDTKGDTLCAVHTLQLCINSGLELSKRLLQSACKLVGHFKHSPKASRALEKAQEALNMPAQALVQMVKTRWNSAYYMLQRLEANRRPIENVLSDRSITKLDMQRKLKLSDSDWNLIEELNPILQTLEIANTVLCSENKTTLSMVRPLMDKLVNSHLQSRENDTDPIRNFKRVVSSEIERRFHLNSDDTRVVLTSQLASLLDPRYKHLEFETEEMREKIRDALRSEFKKLQDVEKTLGDTEDSPSPPSISEEFRNPLDFLFNRKTSPEEELESYLRLSPVDLHTNPLHWWKLNSAQYPVLAKLAKKYLAIPATSASSERVFSTAGNTVTAKRSRLSAEHVDLLISIHQNRRYLP